MYYQLADLSIVYSKEKVEGAIRAHKSIFGLLDLYDMIVIKSKQDEGIMYHGIILFEDSDHYTTNNFIEFNFETDQITQFRDHHNYYLFELWKKTDDSTYKRVWLADLQHGEIK